MCCNFLLEKQKLNEKQMFVSKNYGYLNFLEKRKEIHESFKVITKYFGCDLIKN
jgi:hypothetical protein